MATNGEVVENKLVDSVVSWLQTRLPSTWEVGRSRRGDLQGPDFSADGAIELKGSDNTTCTLLVEARSTFAPRDTDRLLGGMTRAYRTMYGHVPILVVANWISPLAQQRLRDNNVNYIDLTGNAWLKVTNPAVFISSEGARKAPNPTSPGRARVQGPKAGRLLRWLIDVRPPYGVRELAEATDLSLSYVSRVLETLDEEALLERVARGAIESVNIAGLIRRWTDSYSMLRSNAATTYIARDGTEEVLRRLVTIDEPVAVTGSYAAVRRAPVSAPALAAIYTETPDVLAATLGLLPADRGANVVLLKPKDPVVWTRTAISNGVRFVADSQALVDCLTGTGRMPAEGEALLEWMLSHEAVWRAVDLAAGKQQ